MSASGWRKTLIGLIAIAWVGVVLAFYGLVHKPVVPSQAPALGALALTVVGWGATLVCAHWLGRPAHLFLPALPPGEKFALQIGLGLGVLGVGVLGLGAVNGYWPWLIWLAALSGLLFNLRPFIIDLRLSLPRWPAAWPNRLFALFVGLTLLSVWLYSLTPPTAWDALVYHLTGPKLYLQAHRLHHDIDLPYLGFPHWGSMLFLWALLMTGPQLAQLLHFTFMLLTLLLLPSVVNRVAPGRTWLTAALLLSVPTATMLASWAYVEWITIFAGLGAFLCLLQSSDASSSQGPVLVAGVLTGLAFSAKYTAAGMVLGLWLLAVFHLRSWRAIALFSLAAAGGAAPYLLKNLILTGNPVYPFFFAGKFWDTARAYWYSRPGTGLSWIEILRAPWDATIWGLEGLTVEGQVSYNATLGPWLLMLTPWVWVGWRGRSPEARHWVKGLVLVSGTAYAVWALQLSFSGLLLQSRLLLPALPFLIVLAAAGFDSLVALNTARLRTQFVVAGLLGTALVLSAIGDGTFLLQTAPWSYILGFQSQSDYLIAHLGAYAVSIDRINRLPPGSKIMFLWEPRTYYCAAQVDCEPDALLDRWWHLRQLGKDAASIAADWKAGGVTHVLVFEIGRASVEEAGFDPFVDADWVEWTKFKAGLTLIEDEVGAYQLYALK